MLIRRYATGLSLPRAPEFGVDGEWPPVVTQWVPLSWTLFWTDTSESGRWTDPPDVDPAALAAAALLKLYSRDDIRVEDALHAEDALQDNFLHESAFGWFPEGTELRLLMSRSGRVSANDFALVMGACDSDAFYSHPNDPPGELRRAVHSLRWRRRDPVTQLPPGVTYESTQSVTSGLSVEHSHTLADNLGLNLGGEAAGIQAGLSSQIQQEFGFRVDITSQQQQSIKLTLSNSSENRYRKFAVWSVDHQISVDALVIRMEDQVRRSMVFRSSSRGFHPTWRSRGSVEFAAENDSHITYAEVAVG